MNPSGIATHLSAALNSYGRTLATTAAVLAGRGVGVQWGPSAVNYCVRHIVSGKIPQFLVRQTLHVAFGTYYPLVGQVLLGSAVAVCPGPGRIAQTWTGYKASRDYQNQLKTFDPEALRVKAIEDGWLMCDGPQKKPAIIQDDVDTESFDWVGDEAKNLPTPEQMGKPEVVEMDDLASGESAEGFKFIERPD